MKNFLLLSLAALCVSAAQAVTYTWNSSEGTFAGFKDSDGEVVTWSGDFSITLDFTAVSTPATVFQLLTANGADKAGELRFNSTNWSGNTADIGTYYANAQAAWTETNGDFSNDRVVSADGSKGNIMKLTFSGYNETTQKYASLSYDITFANNNTVTWTTNNPNISFGMNELAWTSVRTGDGVTMNSMTLEASPVPEPTVLALLALGVAGLALKRKAA